MEAALERVRPWLEPISGPATAGAPARADPVFEAIAQEVGKLDSPSGGAVNWRSVVEGADGLLRSRSKDLLVAAYLAHALHVTEGAEGLAAGMALLAGLTERYWEVLYPEKKRVRGRVGAIQWFVERSSAALPAMLARGLSAAVAESLEAGARRLAEVAREKLGDATPGFGPLLEALERVRLSAADSGAGPGPASGADVRERQPEPGPDADSGSGSDTGSGSGSGSGSNSDAAGSSAATVGQGVAPTVALPVAALPAGGELSAAADATEFLRGIGDALVQASSTLRSADARDAVAYRVLRTGLWMHLATPPPDQDGRTQVPPPPAALLEKLEALCGHERWAELLDEAESALPRYRLALDLHRHSFQALAGLGAGYERARDAVAIELRALLGRMPRLPELAFADGRPFANPATRTWIDEVVVPRPRGPKFGRPGASLQAYEGNSRGAGACPPLPQDGDGASNGEAQGRFHESCSRLAGGDVSVLAELQRDIGRPEGRSRFVAGLEVARACAAAGLAPLALAAYEGLERESVEHRLDEWEPGLAAECLEGLISAARASGEDPRCAMPQIAEQFRRLCRLDPAAAHKVWP